MFTDSKGSKCHYIDVELINGDVLREVLVRCYYEYERGVINSFFNLDFFKHGNSYYPIDKVLSVSYVGKDDDAINEAPKQREPSLEGRGVR